MEANELSTKTKAGLTAGNAKPAMEEAASESMEFSKYIEALKEEAVHDSDEEQGEKLAALAERAEGVSKGIGTLLTEFNAVITGVGQAIGDEGFPALDPDPTPPPEM